MNTLCCLNFFTIVIIFFFLVAIPGLISPAEVGADTRRAVWIWEEDSFRLLDNERFRGETVLFLKKQHISTLYLYADVFQNRNILADEPGKYRNFIAKMHGLGFKVYALLGSWYLQTPEYILPEKRDIATRMFRNVLAYNAASDSVSRFDGINIDIEPYLLDDWNQKKTLRILQYLDLSAEFMRMKKKFGSSLCVGPAMPFWFDGINDVTWSGKRKKLNEHIQDIYDYVAIMDYRNYAEGPDSIISHASNELAYADSVRRKVVIGVETIQTQPEKVTFFGMGKAAMERELSLSEAAFSSYSSFDGFAIHHLGSYGVLVGGP